MFSAHILVLCVPCAIVLVAALQLTRRRVYPLPLPPGPRPLPVLGNALRVDTKRPWLTYTAWGKVYGDIIYSRLLGIDMIVINSDSIARELLNKRSAIYSDRPVIHTTELSGLSFNTGLLPYGETLQQHRKIFHQVLKADASLSYHEMFSRQASELVIDLLDTVNDVQKPMVACNRYMGSLSMGMTYGHIAEKDSDPILDRTHELAGIVSRIITPERAALFAAFPFLANLPTWCFSRDYALMGCSKELCQQLLDEPFNEVKAQMAKGAALQSLVADFLNQPHNDADEETLKAVACSGYMAGTGTASPGCLGLQSLSLYALQAASAILTSILAMVQYPNVQERARAEINQVVKNEMIPSMVDRTSLPYIDAIIREVLRWYPLAPLGIAHLTSKDDVCEGYFMPKGALVMVNQWRYLGTKTNSPTHCASILVAIFQQMGS